MRSARFFLLLPVLALAAVSCNVEEEFSVSDQKGFVASLEAQSNLSRTSLSGSSVLWSTGDVIQVCKTSSLTDAVKVSIDPVCNGKPEGWFYGPECDEYYKSQCYALYPASMVGEPSGSSLTVVLPSVQQAGEQSFDTNANPSFAYCSGDGKLAFKNLCGLVSVAVKTNEVISEVKITSAVDEALWGKGTVDMTDLSKPVLVMDKNITEEQKSLVLKVRQEAEEGQILTVGGAATADGGALQGDATKVQVFYFVVPVGTLGQGFMVTTTTVTGKYMQKYAVAKTTNAIERSICTVMPDFEFVDESEVVIRTDVPNKAFYKDFFSDSGHSLASYKTFPVVDYLNLSYEYFQTDSETNQLVAVYINKQLEVFAGNAMDQNGVLLWPDGEPRFRVLWVNGGYGSAHGRGLWAKGRESIRKFFYNGGSYTGACAGSFLACRGMTDNKSTTSSYLGIWPGYASNGPANVYPNYILPDDCPLLKYYDFGGNKCVEGVRHNNGPYFDEYEMVPGTEVLCINDLPNKNLDKHPAVIAYKPSIWSGRIVISGGHPEQVTDGERLDLMAAYIKYAADGVGAAKAKGILHNGEVRRMVKSTPDDDPAYTKIGDKQCHHFVFALPEGARNICVRLESLENFNLSLRMAEGTFAFKEDAQYKVENTDAVKELKFDKLPKGTWYVGVQCEDAPDCKLEDYNSHLFSGYVYSGNTAVLNGAPYTISVTWN